MKTVCYWFKVGKADTAYYAKLDKVIRSNLFNEGSTHGFKIDTRDSDGIFCQFIEKESFIDKVEDPFGNLLEVPRVVYNTIYLRVYKKVPLVEFVNPGKYSRRITSIFEEKAEVSLFLVKPNLNSVLVLSEKKFEKTEVVSAQTEDFLINSKTNCSVVFNGAVDVREDANHFLKNTSFCFASIRLKFSFKKFAYVAEFNSGGRCVLNCDLMSSHHDLVRTMLRDILKSAEGKKVPK